MKGVGKVTAIYKGKNNSEAPKTVAEEHKRNFPHGMEIRMDSDINVSTCLS